MTTADVVEHGKLDIGRVIQQTFSVLGRNFSTFFVLALILVGGPSLIAGLLNFGRDTVDFTNLNPAIFPVSLLALVANAVLQGALIYGTVQDLNGAKPTVTASLATGLRAFLPLIGLSILMAIALVFGFLLLVVPGVMMACAWCVAVPSLVAERRGVFDSFTRSADLTRHNRWRILGLFVIYAVVFIIVGIVVGIAAGIGSAAWSAFTPINPVAIIVDALVNTVLGVIGSTGVAVLYVELRQAREGAGPQWLAEIFS
jgi:hypothetical protein